MTRGSGSRSGTTMTRSGGIDATVMTKDEYQAATARQREIAASLSERVRATRFQTSHADTPSEPPMDAYTSEGDLMVAAQPSPMARAIPWVAGLALVGGAAYLFTRRK
jgi:hypothetical protein